MNDLIETIREKFKDKCCLVKKGKLSKSGCRISMQDAPKPDSRVIVDFDKPGSPLNQKQTRCDYLIVARGNDGLISVVPLELKKGKLDVGDVVKQLNAGAEAAEKLVPEKTQVKFYPVAAYGRTTHSFELTKLRREENKIWFHRHREVVQLRRCGAKLFPLGNKPV